MTEENIINTGRGRSEFTYEALHKRLIEPIPHSRISQRDVARNSDKKIDYINVTDLKDLLDERAGIGCWSAIVISLTVFNNYLTVVLDLVIHAADGDFHQHNTGSGDDDERAYGDPASRAIAQAFGRCAESHGLAREMWRKELSEEQLNLPATERQVEILLELVKKANRPEEDAAQYYSESREHAFAGLCIGEAMFAIEDLEKRTGGGGDNASFKTNVSPQTAQNFRNRSGGNQGGQPQGGQQDNSRRDDPNAPPPEQPVAQTLGDLITARQLGMIRALAREAGISLDDEVRAKLNCKSDELSKRAASWMITHLQNLPQKKEGQQA